MSTGAISEEMLTRIRASIRNLSNQQRIVAVNEMPGYFVSLETSVSAEYHTLFQVEIDGRRYHIFLKP
jgi:hypothetical protein